jgi:hypothetical protein
MKTVLITGRSESGRILPEDAPEVTDPAVDCSIATIEELASASCPAYGKRHLCFSREKNNKL